ncbi:MAG: replication restart helicase PriA [Verrucomicrobiota bacterium]
MNIAKVVINLSLDQEFDYLIPDSMKGRIRVGSRVEVPFGKGNSRRIGYVVGFKPYSSFGDLKEISEVVGDRAQIPDKLVELAQWMAEYYCCAREQAVRAVLPGVVRSGKIKQKKQQYAVIESEEYVARELPAMERRAKKQAAILRALVRRGNAARLSTLLRETDTSRNVVKSLEEKQLIRLEDRVVERDPFEDDNILPTNPLQPTSEQQAALDLIFKSLAGDDPDTVLLHGITGSGKTEIYLQAIAACLEQGRESIVLVPEISLTPQTIERFRSRFGNTISVMHSGLSDGERFDEWIKIHEGRTKIAVGARSALFAPFRNLALIVVDEEHENTYKQEENPRYHARDIAVLRGKREQATVILGSATPSTESFYNAKTGKYKLASLKYRVDDRTLPRMEVVDMRTEAALRGQAQIFSRRLQGLIQQRLEDGEQTLIFLNRRGYATQMICTKCGFVARCDECSVTYTYHRHDSLLMCHLCGAVIPAYTECPQCKDPNIRYSGLGTEKVEAVANHLFPKARIARMDSDTMTAKNAYTKTLTAFRQGRINILIGTQMIAKGLHFPNVTLVGIVFADLGLHLPDFRAGERTFQLLTQVSGRAGRGEVAGHVIVQSYTPYHPALQYAVTHDFYGFMDEELEQRRALSFPPVTHAVLIHFRGESEIKTSETAEAFLGKLQPLLSDDVEIAGPMPSPIAKIRNKFRYQLMLRTANIIRLTRLLRPAVLKANKNKNVDIYADVDPQSLL